MTWRDRGRLLTPDETARMLGEKCGRGWQTWDEMEADAPALCEALRTHAMEDVGGPN